MDTAITLTLETALIVLLSTVAAALFFRAHRSKRQVKTLGQHIDVLQNTLRSMQQNEASRREFAERKKRHFEENDVSRVENQKTFISQTPLTAVRPVNKEAASVLYALEEWIDTHRPDWRVGFEVSMGAFIKTPRDSVNTLHKSAFSSYNSKRVDFLLIDRFGCPALAVEYHGSGHTLSDDADDRMEVKRMALEQANIPLVEIPAEMRKADIFRMITTRLTVDGTAAKIPSHRALGACQ